jgi:hypothetical protein
MTSTASRLTSPRVIRSLPWISGLVLVAGVIAFLVAHFGNTSKPLQIEPTSNAPPQVSKVQPTVRLDPVARRVAGEFIVTAVTRQNLAKAWQITHPDLRGGLTYKQWLTGNIPVVPFPGSAIAGANFSIAASHPRTALLRVLIFAKPKSGVRAQDFYIGLNAVGSGLHKRWLVSYWAPASGAYVVPNVGQ